MSNIWNTENNQTIIINERFSADNLNYIMENWNDTYIQTTLHKFSSLKDNGEEGESNVKQLRTIYNRYRKNSKSDGTIQVSYKQKGSKTRKGGLIGRYFATGSLSLQSITRPIRQAICKEYYWDVDMVNAHPTILRQYCEENKIECPILESYVINRDAIIKQSGLSKDTFKTEFLAILNGRKFERQFRIQETDDYFVQWNEEATQILENVAKLNPTIYPSKKDYNENGSVTNKMICSIENKILYHTFNYLIEKGYEPEVLCFDGLMVRQKGEPEDLNRTLKNLAEYIEKQTSYKVLFDIKPMNDGLDLSQIVPKEIKTIQQLKELENEKTGSVFDLKYIISLNEKGYADLYYDLYGKDNVKVCGCEPLNGYVWDDKKVLWVPFTGLTYMTHSIGEVLTEHFQEQILILENEKLTDKNINNANAIKGIDGMIQHFKKTLKGILTFKTCSSILKMTVAKLLDTDFKIKMNNYEDLLPISKGRKISLRTLEISKRDIKDYFDRELDVNYTEDPEQITVIHQFMREIMSIHEDNLDEFKNHNTEDELEAFQVNLGYCISGCNTQKVFFIWHGPGGNNAKSTVSYFIEKVFDKYAKSISRSIIEEQDTNKGDAPTPALMAIKGIHVGFIHETAEQMKLSSADIKRLSSGGKDKITGREMRCSTEEFMPLMKPIILCNKKPIMDGSDTALVNRIRYIPFLNKFEPTPKNNKKVENLIANYRDAFFSWCVNGAKKYFDSGVLPFTDLQKAGTKKFAEENDTLAKFINEFCVTEEKTLNVSTKKYKTTVYPFTTFKSDYLQVYKKAQCDSLKISMASKGFECKKDSTGKISFFGIRAKTQADRNKEISESEVNDDEEADEVVNPLLN